MAAPSSTRAAAPRPPHPAWEGVTTCPGNPRASSTGTELAERMLKVRVKRAVLKPRDSLPTMGHVQLAAMPGAFVWPDCSPAPETGTRREPRQSHVDARNCG